MYTTFIETTSTANTVGSNVDLSFNVCNGVVTVSRGTTRQLTMVQVTSSNIAPEIVYSLKQTDSLVAFTQTSTPSKSEGYTEFRVEIPAAMTVGRLMNFGSAPVYLEGNNIGGTLLLENEGPGGIRAVDFQKFDSLSIRQAGDGEICLMDASVSEVSVALEGGGNVSLDYKAMSSSTYRPALSKVSIARSSPNSEVTICHSADSCSLVDGSQTAVCPTSRAAALNAGVRVGMCGEYVTANNADTRDARFQVHCQPRASAFPRRMQTLAPGKQCGSAAAASKTMRAASAAAASVDVGSPLPKGKARTLWLWADSDEAHPGLGDLEVEEGHALLRAGALRV